MIQRLLRNITFQFLIKVITYIFSFLTLLYVTRILQPEAFGRTAFLSSFAGYFVLLSNLGLPVYAMRVCAEKSSSRKELSNVFGELWNINVLLSGIVGTIYILIVMLLPKFQGQRILLLIYGSAILFQMIGCDWLYRGLEKFRFLAAVTLLCKGICLCGILLFVRSASDLLPFAALSILSTSGSSLIQFFRLHRYVDFPFHFRINPAHFRPILTFFMMTCAVYVYNSLDLTMLGFMRNEYETGLYSIAAKGKSVLAATGGLVWSSALPITANLWKNGERDRFESFAAKTLIFVTAFQTAIAFLCFALAPYIILLVGGESYLPAVPAFRILLLSLIPIGASNILGGQVLIPAGKEHRLLQAEIAGAVFNFAANLLLIPLLSGVGAAITTVIAEVIVWILCIYFIRKDLAMNFGANLIHRAAGRVRRIVRPRIARGISRLLKNALPYYCPCCDTHLIRFIDIGFDRKPTLYNPARYHGIDQNVICPVCISLPRHRILIEWMEEHKAWMKNKKILHFAQESSLRLWMDRNGLAADTADLYHPADLKLNIEATGLPDDSYDMIICNHVLEHVSDYRKALSELHRILRPGGKLILSFPVDRKLNSVYEDPSITSESERILHFGQMDHLRVFGTDSPEMLKHAGFMVTEICGKNYEEKKIKPVIGPANYDDNVLWCLTKR